MPTTTVSPAQAIEEYLLVNGSAKATVIAKAIHMSESAARKQLAALVEDGRIEKEGQLYVWSSKKGGGGVRRAEVASRDELVFKYLSQATRHGKTISREDLRARLEKDGHPASGSFIYLSLYRLRKEGKAEAVPVGKRAPEWKIAG